jgi:ATP-dependent RNA helicase DDX21
MHGDIAQNQREVTLKRFKEGKFNVLVATDVASRGLDIPNVDLVIQVEPPKDVETYIHRAGRTARAGRDGTCITFYGKKHQPLITNIEQRAGIKFQKIGIPQPEDVIKASSRDIIKNLDQVNPDIIHLFEEAADILIAKCENDSKKALCTTLAYLSGHYKQALHSRSLLTGQEHCITIEIKLEQRFQAISFIWGILRKFLTQDIVDAIRGMRMFKDQTGAVFDVQEDHIQRFEDVFNHLKD